jgi:phage/plasmid-associated DNA primase
MIENEYQIDRSGCFLTKKQIYQAYQNWCNDHGNRPVSDVNFWKRLSIMFGNSLREERKRIGGDIPRLVNLKLPDDLKPEF